MIEYFDALRRHGEWADARLLDALRDAGQPLPAALRELAHVRGAQETWLGRIEGRAPSLPVWPELSLDELATIGPKVDAAWREFFVRLDAARLDESVTYTNSAGARFTDRIGPLLLHLFTHGQYHRGKVNTLLRLANAEPAGVDFVMWTRLQR